MILDKYFLSNGQALTGSADSTDTIDLVAAGIGNLGTAWLNVRVGTALGGSTKTLTIELYSSADNSTFIRNFASVQFGTVAENVGAGQWLVKMPLPANVRRYVKLRYTTNTFDSGTISAWITDHADQSVSAGTPSVQAV